MKEQSKCMFVDRVLKFYFAFIFKFSDFDTFSNIGKDKYS